VGYLFSNSCHCTSLVFHAANYFGLTPTEDICVLLNNDVNLNNFLDDAGCFTLSAVIHKSHSRMLMALDTKVCLYYAFMWENIRNQICLSINMVTYCNLWGWDLGWTQKYMYKQRNSVDVEILRIGSWTWRGYTRDDNVWNM
jgi:hypothetical protein